MNSSLPFKNDNGLRRDRSEPVRLDAQRGLDRDPFSSVEAAVDAVGQGRIVVVVDDEDRENEGDLIMAAQFATEEKVAFFVKHTSGVICAPLPGERCDALRLQPMVVDNTDAMRTAFTVSVDSAAGTSTGISARDRGTTLRTLADPSTSASHLTRPGHVFPLRSRPGGVLNRPGHTEAAVDLCILANVEPVGVLCEIVKTDGSMARIPDLIEFSRQHGLVLVTIADLIRYRRRTERLVSLVAEARIPTAHGTFQAKVYESTVDGWQHLALVKGDPGHGHDVLVRLHGECLSGDIFGSLRCTCGDELDAAMARIAQEDHGVLIYLRGPSGPNDAFERRVVAYAAADRGDGPASAEPHVGVDLDSADYDVSSQILRHLGISRMRMLTNDRRVALGLDDQGLNTTGFVPLPLPTVPGTVRG